MMNTEKIIFAKSTCPIKPWQLIFLLAVHSFKQMGRNEGDNEVKATTFGFYIRFCMVYQNYNSALDLIWRYVFIYLFININFDEVTNREEIGS